MRKVIPTLAVLLVAAAGAAAHHLYEHHLNSGYAAILRATLDPHASAADEVYYLRQARVAIRTDMGRVTNEKLEQAFQYAAEVQTETGDYLRKF